jgi:hypothetical protein
MQPEHLHFGGGAAGTVLHPLVAVEMAVAIILILCLPRKHAIAPLLLAIFTIPLGQVVVIGGVHFTVLRILILSGLARRAISPKSGAAIGSTSIDRLVTLWAVSALVIISVQYMETQAIIKSLGDFLDLLGGYYVVRFLIQDKEDVRRTIKVLALVTVIAGAFMINEQVTHRNLFGRLGGVSLVPQVRNGKLRSQAAFEVYIDAGVFGAVLIPLLVWLWSDRKSRALAMAGFLGSVTMILTCNSSTPLLGAFGGIFGLCLWRLRRQMRLLRWALVFMLVGLQMVMKAPVWALIARVDLTGSSSGYHRYMLVDNCIRHFSYWWLIGYRYYGNWGWDMWDLSNQFVAVALTGGLLTFVIFILLLSRSFGALGTARKRVAGDLKQEWFLWCLGSALFAHVVSFFGGSYMAQMQMCLFPLLASIAVAISEAKQPALAPAGIASESEFASVSELIGAEVLSS